MLVIPISVIFAAVLPAIVLFIYVYKTDTHKEPLSLLVWTFILGMLSAPCSTFFSGMVPAEIKAGPFVAAVYSAFCQAAIPEELSKFIMLFALIWNNRFFDEKFDGIVYASVVGLGFAALENILYVAQFGTGILASRALLAIPGHFFFGVAMGYFFAIAKFFPRCRREYLALSLIVPILLHGCYDGLLMWAENLNSWVSVVLSLVFYYFVIRLWKVGFKRINAFKGQ